MTKILLEHIGQLVTMAPLAKTGRRTRIVPADLGLIDGAWLALADGKVEAAGSGAVPAPFASPDYQRLDAGGGLVMPGLVDSHTHAIYGGSRASEFAARLAGATYQEIAAAGGGIQSTMLATRTASDESLLTSLHERLARMLALGTTTVEVKTGYGLSVHEELRLLRLLKRARPRQHLEITCLALHARSPEHPDLPSYVAACTTDLLPVVAEEGLARWVDAFIEDGYFSVADVEPYARRARELGLGLRLHADEFSDAGAASAAADWGAAAADHLQFASDAGIRRMAEGGVVATLLPGTSLYTRLPFTQGRRFADAGVPVAIASDFNPGSCRLDNLALLAGVAAVQGGLTPAETVAGVTYVAASALGLAATKGALTPGYDADLLLYPLPSLDEWLADFGRTPPTRVWTKDS